MGTIVVRRGEKMGWRVKRRVYERDGSGPGRLVDTQYLTSFDRETGDPEWTYSRDERNRDKPDTANAIVYDDRGDAVLARRHASMIDFRYWAEDRYTYTYKVVALLESASSTLVPSDADRN